MFVSAWNALASGAGPTRGAQLARSPVRVARHEVGRRRVRATGRTNTVFLRMSQKQEQDQNGLEQEQDQTKAKGSAAENSAARQIMGIRGAADEEDVSLMRIRVQLMKPVTWIPLIWGVACGAAASGNYVWNNPEDIAKLLVCMVMSGPFLTGFTQTINDWYDRDIDAINEPYRPIPSGRITEGQVKAQIVLLLGAGLGTAYGLDVWAQHETPYVLIAALFGSLISYIYSAPPLKLKQNGWIGNYALGASYISLPWWAGQLVFGTLDWKTMLLTMFYSFAGLGIAIVNDFKSIEGDRAMGLNSLPVAFGVEKAKWICVGTIDIFQVLVAAVLFGIGENTYAAALTALILPQMYFQQKFFLKDPIENDVKYQAAAQPFLVLGILVTGLALGHHGPI